MTEAHSFAVPLLQLAAVRGEALEQGHLVDVDVEKVEKEQFQIIVSRLDEIVI